MSNLEKALTGFFTSMLAIFFIAGVVTSVIGLLLMFVWWAFNPGWLMFTLRAIFAVCVFIGLWHELNKWSKKG